MAFLIDINKFKTIIKTKGYNSIKELAAELDIHKNTVSRFLSGNPVFSKSFEKILSALYINPVDILVNKTDKKNIVINRKIAAYVDQMNTQFPSVTFILFGSRARRSNKKYSDWDIGIYSAKKITHAEYLKIRMFSRTLEDKLPYSMDIVNLKNADNDFLKNISKSWMFLAGRQIDWILLQDEAANA
ncbi:MAG: hypothetical protein A2096_15555 [Spirochaetes bacterium GWF1_41_5]|nr:MAG: hypothetical protein A2096_15555 [Spirochaetes bacterium GWF1_41_5]HBE04840.1 hypothetical protein [Spirochaetia bacterium]